MAKVIEEHVKDPGRAITHFIGMLMAIFAAIPLLIKAAHEPGRIFYMFFYYFCHNLPLLKIMLYSSFVFSYVVSITTCSYINIITVIFKKASP